MDSANNKTQAQGIYAAFDRQSVAADDLAGYEEDNYSLLAG